MVPPFFLSTLSAPDMMKHRAKHTNVLSRLKDAKFKLYLPLDGADLKPGDTSVRLGKGLHRVSFSFDNSSFSALDRSIPKGIDSDHRRLE